MRTLDRVRRIALALPGVNERMSHGEPCFFVRDKRPLCYFHDNHNGDGRIALWCPVPPRRARGDGERRTPSFLCAAYRGEWGLLRVARGVPRYVRDAQG